MTENEYIRATNRVKVSAAIVLLRDVLPGYVYGITEEDFVEIIKRLVDAEKKLFASYEVEEG